MTEPGVGEHAFYRGWHNRWRYQPASTGGMSGRCGMPRGNKSTGSARGERPADGKVSRVSRAGSYHTPNLVFIRSASYFSWERAGREGSHYYCKPYRDQHRIFLWGGGGVAGSGKEGSRQILLREASYIFVGEGGFFFAGGGEIGKSPNPTTISIVHFYVGGGQEMGRRHTVITHHPMMPPSLPFFGTGITRQILHTVQLRHLGLHRGHWVSGRC